MSYSGMQNMQSVTDSLVTKVPIKGLYLNIDGKEHLFNPKDDITPKESAMISLLFLFVNSPHRWTVYDFEGFVKEKQLIRHFDSTEEV